MVTFVDNVVLHLRGGDGGNGCTSVRREKFKPLAGPDGGNGGRGGDVVLVSDPQVTTLLEYHRRPHRAAESGGFGMGDNRAGKDGEDLELRVPVGTVVKDEDGTVLADLSEPGVRVAIAAGGVGGLGNAALASQKRKAPGFHLLGTPGWTGDVVLELKTIADAALVGYPSAGKSSLIAAVSAARPKIADYPFTTLQPNLGVVQAGETRYTIADVPGLIEGASEGRGLGLDFLRHIERCRVIVHVLDCATLEPGRDPLSDLAVVRAELTRYTVAEGAVPLADRPALVVLNKIDVAEGRELAEFVRPAIEELGFPTFLVSTLTRDGLRELTFALGALIAEARAADPVLDEAPRIVLRPKAVDDAGFVVRPEQHGDEEIFRVLGAKPERWVAQTDFTNDEAVGYLADRLARLGVEDALFEAGAVAGATVVIGAKDGVVFDWEPTLTSAAEVMVAPRGSDPRISGSDRRTNRERRVAYTELMDAKAEARAELEREREAGLWEDDRDGA